MICATVGGKTVTKTVVSRDAECASLVQVMAELGRFDKAFDIYGTAVSVNNEIIYRATSDEKKLNQFVRERRLAEEYYTPVDCMRKLCKVPAGMDDEIGQALKYKMIKQMKNDYEVSGYFELMQPIFETPPNNNSYSVLNDFKEQIDGYFDDGQLQLFKQTVRMSYEAKVLTKNSYDDFIQWHNLVRNQMDDNPSSDGTVERTFYGFVYKDADKFKVIADANEMNICHRYYELFMKGYVMGPIINKTYCFNEFCQLTERRNQFKKWLLDNQNREYFDLLIKIKSLTGVIDEDRLSVILNKLECFPKTHIAINYYKNMWNLK